MKILFLTIGSIQDVSERGIYTDLMRRFRDKGHEVFIVTPTERRQKQKTTINKQDSITLLKIKILNIKKTNVIEKGISTLLLEHQFLAGIKKNILGVKFDWVIYSTPPITFAKVISYIKQRDGAKSYLLLKDIFPQNAVDIGMIKKKGLIHRYFRHKEKQLYRISDFIGCMSPANVKYIMKHNPEIDAGIIEVNPNSIEPDSHFVSENDKKSMRERLGIPPDSTAFIYGGNLGKPQGIDFLLEVLSSNRETQGIFFVIIGSGTEFLKVETWFKANTPKNATLLSDLPKNEYDQLVQACHVGLIFLDRRFTIPNFPSRLLSYLEYKIPVLIATDENSDMGKIAEENNFGLYSAHGDLLKFNKQLEKITDNQNLINEMGENGYQYLLNNYLVDHSYKIMMNHFK